MARKLGSSARHLTLEEKINRYEGEDELTDDGPEKEISFDEYLDDLGMNRSSDSEGSQQSNKRRRLNDTRGERVAFDDDEDSDDAYNKFKNRKAVARSKARATTKRVKAKVAKGSMVGRKPKSAIPLKDGKRKERVYGDDSDHEMALMETTLPDYLQKRMKDRDARLEKFKEAGLFTPPDYDEVYFSGDERLEKLDERPRFSKGTKQGNYEDVELKYSAGIIPAPVAQWLRDYQIKGAEFLHELFVWQKGGILGDDMGLGKTIQVIAFLTAAFGKTGDERDDKRMRKVRRLGDGRWYPRVLIIAPGTLLLNWKAELERWGWWQIYTYHGNPTSKKEAIAAAYKGRLEIMITTYETYRLNPSEVNQIRWDCVIADECHKIKETKAEITKAMNDVNALCRIGLTGTAIQNKYEELWTLLNWTNPGRLGPLANWKQAICIPLKLGQSHDATNSQLAKGRRTAEKLVNNLLPQFFLRRMKSLIAHQLPKKSDQVVFCPLTETQVQAYNNFCDSEIVRTIHDATEPCRCGSGKKQGWCCYQLVDDQKWQNYVFPMLMTLQKLSNHLFLLVPNSESNKEQHDKDLDKLKIAAPEKWREMYRNRENILEYSNPEYCGKWKVLRKLLQLWRDNGDKVLVFSHSVKLLKMLRMLFQNRTSYKLSYLDGSMSYEDRQRVVDEYNADASQFVFLISTKAGGVGLNITSANKVVVVDPNWNPSYDLQAQDRAYRIGQTRDVEVFRLVSVGTVEEIVYARQIYKQQQANIGYNATAERRYFKGVQDQKEMKGEIFGLQNLFAPLSEDIRLREIVNKTNVAETKAGVQISGLNLEASQEDDESANPLTDENKEAAAMSQLAADIIDEPAAKRKAAARTAKTKDAVQAILASVGVQYTHENAEVIGTSKIETKISSRAQKAGNDLDMNTDYAFARSQSQRGGGGDCDASRSRTRTPHHDSDASSEMDAVADVEAGQIPYRYQPPEDVRRRQFCEMAKQFDYDDVTEFALVVEGWTQEERRDFLDSFYKGRRKKLARSHG